MNKIIKQPDSISDSRLVELLKTLNEEEFKAFGRFVKSPYFNKVQNNITLYDYLAPEYPDFRANRRLEKRKVFKLLRGMKVYQKKYVNDRLSDLTKLLEHFMVIEEVHTHKTNYQEIQRIALSKRLNLYDIYLKNSQDLAIQLSSDIQKDWQNYHQQWLVFQALYEHPENDRHSSKTDYFPTLLEKFELFFVLMKLSHVCISKARGKTFKNKDEISLLNQIRILATTYENQHPLIKIYKLLTLLFENPKKDTFIEVENLYLKHFNQIKKRDSIIITLNLINIVTFRYTAGDTTAPADGLRVYKFALNHNLLIINGRLSDIAFGNIISMAALSQQFDWAKSFINNYTHFLKPQFQPYIQDISHAHLLFYQGHYSTAIDTVRYTKPTDWNYKLRLRSILSKCYFECFLQDSTYRHILDTYLSNFELFLKRKEDRSLQQKQAYFHFIDFIKKLTHLLDNRELINDVSINELTMALYDLKPIISKAWLQEKIERIRHIYEEYTEAL